MRNSDAHLRASLKSWLWALAFVGTFALLDHASHGDPLHRLNIAPWNPAPALGLLFLLRGGAGGAATLLAAMLASDVLARGLGDYAPITVWLNVVLAGGYAALAALLRYCCPDGGLFADRDGLLRWSAVVIFGTLANSVVFVSSHVGAGLLDAAGWGNAVLRFWVGDGVGIFVALPLFWWLQDRHRALLFRSAILNWETLAYLALMLAVLWIAFDLGASANFRYFYVLFLPLVWASSRQGLAGAVFCVSALQIGMAVAGQMQVSAEISMFELQMRALVLALVGFFIGAAVDEQRRAAADLRQSLRLAAAGEMAAALAHELNQPLTALSAYGSACERLLNQGNDEKLLREVIQRMIGEAGRAAEVVRRLRDFFRTGSTHLEQFPLPDLIDAATRTFREKAPTRGVGLEVGPSPDISLHAERLQLEVVLRNLLANAFDAVASRPEGERRVGVSTAVETAGRLCIRVEDSGPGIAGSTAERLFEPFVSSKSSGLGLGLAISRAIAEAHGGALVAEVGKRGCFKLFLPLDSAKETVHV